MDKAVQDAVSEQIGQELQAYAQAQTYGEQVRLLDENVAQYDELVPILKLRLEKGMVQPLDVDRVEVTRRNVASQRVVAQANYDLAIAKLKRVMGMPMNETVELTEPLREAGNMRQPSATTFAPSNVLGYKYDEQSVRLYDIDLQRKRSAYLPTLSAYGRLGATAQGNELGGRPSPTAHPDDDHEPRVTLVLEGLVLALDGNPAEGAVVSSSRAARG